MNKHISKKTLDVSRRGFVVGAAGLTFSFTLGANLTGRLAEALAADGAKLNAWVTIGNDGTITILCPTSEMGQGVLTSLPLMLARTVSIITMPSGGRCAIVSTLASCSNAPANAVSPAEGTSVPSRSTSGESGSAPCSAHTSPSVRP